MSTSATDAPKDPRIIDGNAIAAKVRAEVAEAVNKLKESGHRAPGIAVLLVGDRTDSSTYVRMKKQACEQVGFVFQLIQLPSTTSEEEIIQHVRKFNEDRSIHGILVQLPLPIHVNETRVLDEVHREKDVDGFHPLNIGQLAMKGYEPAFVSCTPKGCLELLLRENIPIAGKHAVVIGRSNIVGIPMSLLLLKQNATVTVCHSRTENLPELVKQADIVVAAIGRPLFVQKEWIKPGATIIDVGINSVPDASRKTGYRLVGDVDKEAYDVAGRYTPVPGGVGPMTVAMLLQNTLLAAQKWYARETASSS
eukprot:TRINITY_DN6378_c0_g1_i2.p1 TRINITY_DN6378_c0_g1~~TRINITY_DN6378_c0_g1_i2.p1  ORF type:complete len:332 (+),score=83.91 TRINITY_DN6378_c0_g1_i2:74-997(+)